MEAEKPNNKLDMSLDAIKDLRKTERINNRRGGRGGSRSAPYNRGGPRGPRAFPSTASSVPPVDVGGKILISNLDFKVSESDLRELFSSVGPLKKVSLSFDSAGKSKGTAEILFVRRNDALVAVRQYNNVALDGRPMKIEVVARVSSSEALAPALAGRLSSGPVRPTRPSTGRQADSGARGRRGGFRGRRKFNKSDGPAKTADELNAEMDSYMKPSEEGNGGTAPSQDVVMN